MPAPLVGTITSPQGLREHLLWAIELRHSTISPYLCALYSIEPGRNLEAVEVLSGVQTAIHWGKAHRVNELLTGGNADVDQHEQRQEHSE
jgi:hypothetical protein